MARVRLVLRMERPVHCLVSLARTGSMMIRSKIILCSVSFEFWKDAIVFSDTVVMFLGWTQTQTQRTIIAFSTQPNFLVRIPATTDNTSLLMLSVSIRDIFDCAVEFNLPTVTIAVDKNEFDRFMSAIKTSGSGIASSLLVQALRSGNQNAISQVTALLAQRFNTLSTKNVEFALNSKLVDNNLSDDSWDDALKAVAFLQRILPLLNWVDQLDKR